MKDTVFELKWDKEQTNDLALKFILFGISPFFASIYSFRRLNTRSSFLILLLTGMFFGMAFTVSHDDLIDGARHRLYFEMDYFINWRDYKEIIFNYFTFDSSVKDIYRYTISFFVSRFTDNYHWYFFVVATIYGYFSLKSLRFFTSLEKFKFSWLMLILLYIFLKQDIFNINGVRFWTAGWIAIYCVFQFFVSNNKKYFFVLCITPMIHISFWLIPLMLMVSFLYDKVIKINLKDKLIYGFYFFSFIFSIFAVPILSNISDYLPPIFSKLVSAYIDGDYINEINDFDRTLTGMYFRVGTQILINLMVVLLIFNKNLIINDRNIKGLFYFILLMLSFVNIFMFIPSLGIRFFEFSLPFIAFLWAYVFGDTKYKFILLLIPFVFFRDIYVSFLLYSSVLDFFDLISSPFYLFYHYLIEGNL